ncbi:MAG: response regulator SirA [Lentisphaerae bacterium]|nr:response regulator SirA [Lentisphaerota bacterium]
MKLTQIVKRDGTVVKYDRDRVSTAVFRAMASVGHGLRADAERIALHAEEVLTANYRASDFPSVEDIQDIVEQSLSVAGFNDVASAYMVYRSKRAQARAARDLTFEVTDNIPYKTLYETLKWNMEHGCESVDKLNNIIDTGQFPVLVGASELRFHADIGRTAQQLIENREKIRIAVIAGPSSSGKTTTTMRLSEFLAKAGLRLKTINVDNYFFDRDLNPKDEFGDYDYEKPHSLDLNLIDEHLCQLLDGNTIRMPYYDFKEGIRQLDVTEMHLEEDEILLIDSLHGLYGEMMKSVPSDRIFKIYVETLGQLRGSDGVFMRWADIRLMRRMIRDSVQRNSQPLDTLTHWHYVRRSELQFIIPFIGTVNSIINTALAYETAVLKQHIQDYLPPAIDLYRDDPRRQDAYIRAKRLRDFLEPIRSPGDEKCIPTNSLIREFIGGSIYTY